jgi:hypothetical protein
MSNSGVRVTLTSARVAMAGKGWSVGTGRIPEGKVVVVVVATTVVDVGGIDDVVGALLLVV